LRREVWSDGKNFSTTPRRSSFFSVGYSEPNDTVQKNPSFWLSCWRSS
jgi:hypothetical protein